MASRKRFLTGGFFPKETSPGMDDFAAKPGTPNMYGLIQGERNAVAPYKRPLSAMTPTIVLRKDGSFWLTVGSPGGPPIMTTVLCIITDVID
jgi:gamma-glutamyltranspeptidase/glutathione hydrolase